jgi:uncharacterized membrane protein HdeD (DUF308 family)
MRVILAKNWRSLLIRGATAIVLGTIVVLWRDISLRNLVLVFFNLALLDRLVALAGVVRAAEARERWAPLLLEAVIGIAAGVLPGGTFGVSGCWR